MDWILENTMEEELVRLENEFARAVANNDADALDVILADDGCVLPMTNLIHVLILTSRGDFWENYLKQDLNPGEGASPDSFFPFSDLQSQN